MLVHICHRILTAEAPKHKPAVDSTHHTSSNSSNGVRSRRRRPEAAGHVGEPGGPAGAPCPQHQGHQLRVPRGGLRQQERAAPPLQPRPQDGPRADPRRQARLRVDDHHTVPRRGFCRRRPPPGRPLRARRRPLLGRLHRRHARESHVQGVVEQDGGGEGGGEEAGGRRLEDVGRSPGRRRRREALLWRRQPRVRGHGARRPPRMGALHGRDHGRQDHRPRDHTAPGRVGGPLRRAGRGGGGHAGREQAGGVHLGDVGSCCGRGHQPQKLFCFKDYRQAFLVEIVFSLSRCPGSVHYLVLLLLMSELSVLLLLLSELNVPTPS